MPYKKNILKRTRTHMDSVYSPESERKFMIAAKNTPRKMCHKEHKPRVRTKNSLEFLRSHSSEFVFERNEIYVHDERDKCV